MKTHIFPITFFLSCTLYLFSGQVASAKTYKLVDESGKTSFSDQVSPDEAKYRRETLSKHGTVVEVTEQEKTKEQQERDRNLERLRKKQEKVIQSQKAHDDALLRTYHTKEEMLAELKTKTQTIEAQRKLIESEVTQQLERLDTKQKSAATFERNAQPIPPNLIEEIKNIQSEIERTKKTIDENLAIQQKLADEYEINTKRFLVLTQSDKSEQNNKVASIEEADALGLFRCENDFECKKAWEIARLFVDTYSTTEPDINTEKLMMHALPTKDSDISLSISKIASRDAEDQLFLDIHCRESSLGKELCASPKTQALRSSFRSYVNERLNNKVPTP
ncbi:MAG: DUF4124 domain-containing protein [Methylococcaceae bacterium]|nr:DUF4124 domain-containing protein [Methylococcaceae bacterium]MDD1607338.1 DUF4124 domain-containing protein [Methylococcaceae bacterium]